MRAIQASGNTCVGFDPALQKPSKGLYKSIFKPGKSKLNMRPDVFIMRCVLPHLSNPDEVLNDIFSEYPEALIYAEYQDFAATQKTGAFWQVSHDHVNYFTTNWFEQECKLVDNGVLSGEWSWALVGPKEGINRPESGVLNHLQVKFPSLEYAKKDFLSWAESYQPLVILGAGGKGANLGFQLVQERIEVSVVDLDPQKQNRFLEGSGLEVFPYSHLELDAKNATRVLLNPNYKDEVMTLIGSSNFEVFGN